MYTPEDQHQYGKFQPVPSLKLGARITQATIMHGSTQTASSILHVLYPWFLAVESNHMQLEVQEVLSWNEVATCHREIHGSARECLGNPARPGVTDSLDGAVILPSTLVLGDALVGH